MLRLGLIFCALPALGAVNFECVDTSQTYQNLTANPAARNPLYTKLVGTAFTVDAVAIGAGGVRSTGFVANNVRVELFDDSTVPAPACSAYAGPVASQLVNFTAANQGRRTLTFTLNRAYRKLRCRVTDTSSPPAVVGCSSDTFTVRPTQFTSVTSTANADASGVSATRTPIVKAGAPFSITANTNTVGYNGSPSLNTTLINASGSVVGSLTGVFSAAANSATGNGASGAAFAYGEVGYLQLRPNAVFDNTFSQASGDVGNGDCIDSGANQFSNVLVGGKYGCRFGNMTNTAFFGRFVPDHFTLAATSLSGQCGSSNMMYMDQTAMDASHTPQPWLVALIEARNTLNAVTRNYTGVFAKAVVTPQLENNNGGVAIGNTRLNLPLVTWSNGSYPFSLMSFKRLAAPDGPYDALDIGLGVSDEAGQVLLTDRDMASTNTSCISDTSGKSDGTCTAKKLSSQPFKLRYGRLKLNNAFGSEVLPLPLVMRLEYWNGSAGWQLNSLDTCTALAPTNVSFSFPAGTSAKPNQLSACATAITSSGSSPTQKWTLSAPGAGRQGWADIAVNLNVASGNQCSATGMAGPAAVSAYLPWLQYNWTGSGVSDPKARVNFGLYKNAPEFIYLRELH